MDPRLHHYLRWLRSITRADLHPSAIVRRAAPVLSELLADPPSLAPEHRVLPEEEGGYGRNLLYRDPESDFVTIAMIWPSGYRGAIHDHGTWGVVGVLEGTVRIVNYGREDGGGDPARIDLVEIGRVEAGPGAVAHVLPPHEDFHSVSNVSATEGAITLHTYGHDIPMCRVVDLDTGSVSQMQSSYTSEACLVV